MAIIIHNNVIHIFPNAQDLSLILAKEFAERARASVNLKGVFTVVLAGGNTPKLLFDTLTSHEEFKKHIPWAEIKFFFGDERYVASDNPNSNYYMAYHHLFSKVPVPIENVYRIPIEFGYAADVAREYERILRDFFQIQSNEYPDFDLVLLGLGEDGHTASLMPMSRVVLDYCERSFYKRESSENKNPKRAFDRYPWVSALWYPSQGIYQRITLTPPVINHAKIVQFMVTGENKASAVFSVLTGPENPKRYPAQLIQCLNEKNIWFLDEASASQLLK